MSRVYCMKQAEEAASWPPLPPYSLNTILSSSLGPEMLVLLIYTVTHSCLYLAMKTQVSKSKLTQLCSPSHFRKLENPFLRHCLRP